MQSPIHEGYEYQDYFVETKHRFLLNGFFINDTFWDSLPEMDQGIFEDAVSSAEINLMI